MTLYKRVKARSGQTLLQSTEDLKELDAFYSKLVRQIHGKEYSIGDAEGFNTNTRSNIFYALLLLRTYYEKIKVKKINKIELDKDQQEKYDEFLNTLNN